MLMRYVEIADEAMNAIISTLFSTKLYLDLNIAESLIMYIGILTI